MLHFAVIYLDVYTLEYHKVGYGVAKVVQSFPETRHAEELLEPLLHTA